MSEPTKCHCQLREASHPSFKESPHHRDCPHWVDNSGAALIAQERRRQIAEEGFSEEHDDVHQEGEIAEAGLSYLIQAVNGRFVSNPPSTWPWDKYWWKPSEDPIRNLVKAGALLAAEIDRLQRLK